MSLTVKDIYGLVCPACGSDEFLQVAIETWANLSSDGTDFCGHHDWYPNSSCRCSKCEFTGTVETFRIPSDPDPFKTFSVTFSENVSYRAVVQARNAETARTLVQNQLSEGGVDSLEETHNCRSAFEVEEVCA